MVDKNGFILAVLVTVAHFYDSKVVMQLMRVLQDSYCNIELIIADDGYRDEIIEAVKRKFGYCLQVALMSDITFKPVHKRGVVERTFARFDNNSRLCRNCELIKASSEERIKLHVVKLLLNKF